MIKILASISFLLPVLVAAATFEERVDAAKAGFETAEGMIYEQKLGPYLGSTMQICIPYGSTSTENLGRFTYVANVSIEGRISASEVKPLNAVSLCFDKEFTKQILPQPPSSLFIENSVPIVVELNVVP